MAWKIARCECNYNRVVTGEHQIYDNDCSERRKKFNRKEIHTIPPDRFEIPARKPSRSRSCLTPDCSRCLARRGKIARVDDMRIAHYCGARWTTPLRTPANAGTPRLFRIPATVITMKRNMRIAPCDGAIAAGDKVIANRNAMRLARAEEARHTCINRNTLASTARQFMRSLQRGVAFRSRVVMTGRSTCPGPVGSSEGSQHVPGCCKRDLCRLGQRHRARPWPEEVKAVFLFAQGKELPS